MSACDCGSWDGGHQGDCSLFLTAPESHLLTKEEREAILADELVFANMHSDWAKANLFGCIERIFATRTAALLDRLKAAEGERDEFAADLLDHLNNGEERYAAQVTMLRERAEKAGADKARAVAETRVALLDQVERRLKAERDKHYVFGSRLGRCHDADLAIVRALRAEVSGR